MLAAFLENYSDIIYQKEHCDPSYPVIHFGKFLSRYFSKEFYLIDKEIIAKLREQLKITFGNDHKCFVEHGITQNINFTELQYYQSEVGINGPKHSNINDPVSILRIDKNYILFNGYHRALNHILKQETSIQGKVLEFAK